MPSGRAPATSATSAASGLRPRAAQLDTRSTSSEDSLDMEPEPLPRMIALQGDLPGQTLQAEFGLTNARPTKEQREWLKAFTGLAKVTHWSATPAPGPEGGTVFDIHGCSQGRMDSRAARGSSGDAKPDYMGRAHIDASGRAVQSLTLSRISKMGLTTPGVHFEFAPPDLAPQLRLSGLVEGQPFLVDLQVGPRAEVPTFGQFGLLRDAVDSLANAENLVIHGEQILCTARSVTALLYGTDPDIQVAIEHHQGHLLSLTVDRYEGGVVVDHADARFAAPLPARFQWHGSVLDGNLTTLAASVPRPLKTLTAKEQILAGEVLRSTVPPVFFNQQMTAHHELCSFPFATQAGTDTIVHMRIGHDGQLSQLRVEDSATALDLLNIDFAETEDQAATGSGQGMPSTMGYEQALQQLLTSQSSVPPRARSPDESLTRPPHPLDGMSFPSPPREQPHLALGPQGATALQPPTRPDGLPSQVAIDGLMTDEQGLPRPLTLTVPDQWQVTTGSAQVVVDGLSIVPESRRDVRVLGQGAGCGYKGISAASWQRGNQSRPDMQVTLGHGWGRLLSVSAKRLGSATGALAGAGKAEFHAALPNELNWRLQLGRGPATASVKAVVGDVQRVLNAGDRARVADVLGRDTTRTLVGAPSAHRFQHGHDGDLVQTEIDELGQLSRLRVKTTPLVHGAPPQVVLDVYFGPPRRTTQEWMDEAVNERNDFAPVTGAWTQALQSGVDIDYLNLGDPNTRPSGQALKQLLHKMAHRGVHIGVSPDAVDTRSDGELAQILTTLAARARSDNPHLIRDALPLELDELLGLPESVAGRLASHLATESTLNRAPDADIVGVRKDFLNRSHGLMGFLAGRLRAVSPRVPPYAAGEQFDVRPPKLVYVHDPIPESFSRYPTGPGIVRLLEDESQKRLAVWVIQMLERHRSPHDPDPFMALVRGDGNNGPAPWPDADDPRQVGAACNRVINQLTRVRGAEGEPDPTPAMKHLVRTLVPLVLAQRGAAADAPVPGPSGEGEGSPAGPSGEGESPQAGPSGDAA